VPFTQLFQAPDYWLSRLLISRGIGAIYLIAFICAFNPVSYTHLTLPTICSV